MPRQEFEFNYVKFFRNPVSGARSAEKKLEYFSAESEGEARAYVAAYCLKRGHGYAPGTLYRRDGITKYRLSDPLFPGEKDAA